jgi:hypothetical protein
LSFIICKEKKYPNLFFSFLGTQSPDAVNKLLRLSDSNHQIKSRIPQKSNPNSNISVLRSASPLINNSIASTSELTQQRRYHHPVTKMRDANKLTSESSSINPKPTLSTLYTRSHIRELFS